MAEVQIDGEECGSIDREHEFGCSSLRIVSYEVHVTMGGGSYESFDISKLGTPSRALAAAKAHVRAVMPRLLAEEA